MIELLVVIVILGIFGTGIYMLMNPGLQVKRANDAKRKSDLAQLQRVFESYYNDNGRYPGSVSGMPDNVAWGSAFGQYTRTLPLDPKSPDQTYYYHSPAGNQSFYIYASLEAGGTGACNGGSECSTISSLGIPTTACGTNKICNYGVSSSNVTP
jgi:prepilin-type N-terminal cleavage/methylation domain-containing protein